MARDLIATLQSIDPNAVDLRIDLQLPGEAQDRLARVEGLREQRAMAKHEAATRARGAATELKQADTRFGTSEGSSACRSSGRDG